jgi:hypothetical protein
MLYMLAIHTSLSFSFALCFGPVLKELNPSFLLLYFKSSPFLLVLACSNLFLFLIWKLTFGSLESSTWNLSGDVKRHTIRS